MSDKLWLIWKSPLNDEDITVSVKLIFDTTKK